MYETVLSTLGLSKSEISVYFALIDLGSSTTGPIIKKAQISSGKVYIVLNKLAQKGLITHILKSGVRYYQAKDPQLLLSFLREKENILRSEEKKLNDILPGLKAKFRESKSKTTAEVYEGLAGIKSMLSQVLDELHSGEIFYVLSQPNEAFVALEEFFLEFNKQREKKGVLMKALYNSDCRGFGEKRQKFALTKVKYMRQELSTPAWIIIAKDNVGIAHITGTPGVFLIKDKVTADTYLKHFAIMWKLGVTS